MRHPTEGTLRRLVDEPDGVADADRRHVAGCPACLAGLAAAQHDAALVGAALGPAPATAPDADSAWLRLTSAFPADGPADAPVAAPVPRRRRLSLRHPAIAAAGAVALLTGAGAAAAADWLPIFRTERIAPAP